jgi:Asp-tRNA(Asn)/Glu-tRNA(Gln) amidotransferase A subunit family amidase
MDTTCGSYALQGAKAYEDAAVIKELQAAGLIVLGKANIGVSCCYALT